jgi:polyisoprenoid-binding protein YceI
VALRRRRGLVIGGLVVLVLLLAAGGALAWYALGDDAPPPPTLADAPAADAQHAGSPDGTWRLGAKPGYVGYRVQELFAGETLHKDAVGRTTKVTGTIVFANSQLQSVNVTANVQALKSDRAPRDSFLHSNSLETDRYPTGTFQAVNPLLPAPPASGKAFDVQLPGDLTIHGVTRRVTLPLRARRVGDRIDVVGTAPILFRDYDIQTPSSAIVKTEDHGDLEIDLTFRRA